MNHPAPDPALADALPAGCIVGEYRIDGQLGEGGFGTVYRATHPLIGKSAALKVLKHEFSVKAETVSRFVAEARAVNQIRHRNIIDIFSFGKLPDGRHFYVMELLEGQTLEDRVQARGTLPIAEAIDILRPLARALAAAHAHGVAHRDLKPENVFLAVDDEGRVTPKLLDFGIAKLSGELGSQHKTQTGMPLGTPAYMSPEQVHGKNVDYRTDIYSFGILVFEVLTGRLPFEGTSVLDVMVKQTSVEAPRLSSRKPDLAVLDAAVQHMLEKDADARPQTMLAAINAITDAAAAAGVIDAARYPPLVEGGLPPTAAASQRGLEVSDGKTLVATPSFAERSGDAHKRAASDAENRAPSRARWLVAALGAGVVVALVVGFVAWPKTRVSGAAVEAASSSAPISVAGSARPEAAFSAAPVAVVVAPLASSAPSSSVTITLEGWPADVEVFRGSERLGDTQSPLMLPRGSGPVRLELRRKGHPPETADVVPDHDQKLTVTPKPIKRTQSKEYGTWD